jgi:hypothetical protein
MERAKYPVAASVTGEHAPGSISPVGRWRQSYDQAVGPEVTEDRNRFCPVFAVGVRLPLGGSDGLSPFDEPGAEPALNDLRVQEFDLRALGVVVGHERSGGSRHASIACADL